MLTKEQQHELSNWEQLAKQTPKTGTTPLPNTLFLALLAELEYLEGFIKNRGRINDGFL